MRGSYLAALIAITMSIAFHVLVLGAFGPIVPEFVTGFRSRLRGCCRLVGSLFHGWIAAALARRQHQIEAFAQRDLADRELTGVTRDRSWMVR
jgi:hypothetical protein